MDIKPRLAAARSLENILVKRRFSNEETAECLKRHNWSVEDQRLYIRLIYGTLENASLLDAIIRKQAGRPVERMDSLVRGILRISIYQLLFADRIPPYAVIHEAVELTKMNWPKAAGFVNAVLRSTLRSLEKYDGLESFLAPYLEHDPTLRYSHPSWMIAELEKCFSRGDTRKILETHQLPPSLTLRLNFLKGKEAFLVSELEKTGLSVLPTGWLPEAYFLHESSGLLTQSPAYHQGLFQIQSIVSMLAVHWLNPQPGDLVIDVAAAPGGKTTHIGQRMKDSGRIIARDISEKRLLQIRRHAERMGLTIIETQTWDGALPDPTFARQADRVLLDAPCSSVGMVRKKPELKYLKREEDFQELPQIQLALLRASADLVKPGGFLVYSTCTYFRRENQDVVSHFLSENEDFIPVPLEPLPPELGIDSHQFARGWIQLGPHLHSDLDGFFVAKLKRKELNGAEV